MTTTIYRASTCVTPFQHPRPPRASDQQPCVPRTMPGPFGKMGKLRIKEEELKGKKESEVTQC